MVKDIDVAGTIVVALGWCAYNEVVLVAVCQWQGDAEVLHA